MSKYFKKGSVPFKIFACFISVVLVLGCAFIPGKNAYAMESYSPANPMVSPDDTGGGDGGGEPEKPTSHDIQFTDMLLNPGSNPLAGLSWYDDSYAIDPQGHQAGETFKMIEQNSVFNLTHANQEEMKEWANVWQNYSPGTTGKFASSFTNNYVDSNQVPNAMRWSDALQAVAFNVSADVPQKDHVAVIGFDYGDNKKVKLWIYNAKAKKWSDAKVVGNLSWSDDGGDSYYGDLEPFMSITAGDYDGDNVDTVVTYAGDCNSSNEYYGITEWNIKDKGDGTPEITGNNGRDTKFDLLNQAYAANGQDGMKEIFSAAGHHAAGNGSLHAILKTGDFNGDNIDDLAVLSSLEFQSSDEAKKYDWRLGVPYLSISNGQKGGKLLDKGPSFGAYVGEYNETAKTCNSVATANFAVARLGKHSTDSIVVGGRGWSFSGDASGNLSSATHNDTLSLARYDLKDDDTFGFTAYTSQCYEQNATAPTTNTINGFGTECNYGGGNGHWAWNPICAQAVYMNGKGNDPYILMDGDLYHWKENGDAPQKIFKYKDKDGNGLSNYYPGDQNFFPLACTCAGVWDGNTNGYEQVAFGLCHRQGGSGGNVDDYNVTYITIGINPNVHDENTGLPSGIKREPGKAYDLAYSDNLFFCTSKKDDRQIDDKGSISNNGLHFPLCNMDYSAEEGGVAGLVAKYSYSGLMYSDPIVEYISQAPPYYGDYSATTGGKTGYEKSMTISEETTEKNTVSEEDGYSTGFNYSGIIFKSSKKQTKGSVESYTREFSKKITLKHELTVSASEYNNVVVRRYPFCFYNYATYNPTEKKWDENNVTNSLLKWDEVLEAAFTEVGYNYFADKYNEKCNADPNFDGNTLDLLNTNDLSLFGNEGNPENYKPIDGNSDIQMTTPKTPGNGQEYNEPKSIALGNSNSWEQEHGLHFHYDKSFGIGLGISHWALDFNQDNYTDTKEMWGQGSRQEIKYEIGLDYVCRAPSVSDKIFKLAGAKWESNLRLDTDKDKNSPKVPVFGWLVATSSTSNGSQQKNTVEDRVKPPTDLGAAETDKTPTTNEDPKAPTADEKKDNLLSSFIGPVLAYADDTSYKPIKVTWDTGDNPSDCSYQVYTSVNGEIYNVGKPVKGNEFYIDLENPSADMKDVVDKLKSLDLPVYQFAVSAIDANGNESEMSGWLYFCSSEQFKESISCYVTRNKPASNNRLSLLINNNGREKIKKLTDAIGIRKDAHFVTSRWNGKTEVTDLGLKDSFPYKVDSFKFLKADGRDCLYVVQLVNKSNSADVKNCIIRLDDGKVPAQRLMEAEILSNWDSPEAITEAINNPQTHDATVEKLINIYDEINSTSGMRVTGEAKDVYVAGINAYNHYYGFDKQKFDATPVVITIVGLCVLLALGIGLYFFLKKRKTAQAVISTKTTEKKTTAKTTTKSNLKSKSNSKYGVY